MLKIKFQEILFVVCATMAILVIGLSGCARTEPSPGGGNPAGATSGGSTATGETGDEAESGTGESEQTGSAESEGSEDAPDPATNAGDKNTSMDVEGTEENLAGAAAETVCDGELTMVFPSTWESRTPASNILEKEFAGGAASAEAGSARITCMASMGSLDQNLDRWYGQFNQPDGGSTKDVAKVTEMEVNGLKIVRVDITGTFLEGMGPVAPKTEREGYRMLAARVELAPDDGYFIKMTGPSAVVAENETAFDALLKSIAPVK